MGLAEGRPIRVVVVTRDSEHVIAGLLETLERGLSGCEWDLVVVDNASTDGTVALVSRDERARVVEMGGNPGFAAAVNRGLDGAGRQRDLLVLNPDTRLAEGVGYSLQTRLGWVGSEGDVQDASDCEAKIGVVAPVQVDRGGARLPSLRREPTIRRALAETFIGVRRAGLRGWGEAILDPAAYARPTVADWISGAALMISAECIAACGPWDESFFLYSEDAEFALRARDRGYLTCLEPAAVVTHLGGESRRNPALWTLLVRNKVVLYRRRHGRTRGVGFHFASLLRELRLAVSGNRPSRAAAWALLRPGGQSR